MRHRVRRLLPIQGEVKVNVGDKVGGQDIVAETFMPGDVLPVNLANMLNMPPGDVPGCLLKKEGEKVEVGEALARTKGIFGLFKTEYKSKVAGTLESVSTVTGQVILRGEPIPVQVSAFLSGEVAEIVEGQGCDIEAEVTYVQGIFGIGGEVHGTVKLACDSADQELTPDRISDDMKGAVVIGGARMTGDAVRRAIDVGVAAVVSGGMDDQDLKDILKYDLGVAVTGGEKVGVTLVITEGFGEIAMAAKTFELFQESEGKDAAVNGATQIRAGVMRPEVVIPLGTADTSEKVQQTAVAGVLDAGTPVRIIRDPYFGVLGEVGSLPPEPTVLESGSKARVLTVKVGAGKFAGEELTVPRANVEIIGE